MNLTEHYTTVGTQQALVDLGLAKEAFWGAALGAVGRGLWGAGRGLLNFVSKPAANMFGRVGEGVMGAAGRAGVSPQNLARLRTLGQGAAGDAATFGMIGGGVGAATAEPGDRLSGFGRGFAGGALGGAAWRMGSNAATMGMGRALGPQNMARINQAGSQGWFGGGLKGFGAKALTGGVPLAGGLGASMAMPTFEKEPQQQQAQYAQRAMYPAMSYLGGG